jgi:D-amino peptidase
MAESGINAAIAGHFGVPVVAISGDDQAIAEAAAIVPGIEGAQVKRAISFHSAATMTPAAAQALIREKVAAGVRRRAQIRPFVVRPPLRLDLTFKNYRPAEMLAFLPIVERISAHAIRYGAASMIEISKFIEFVTTYCIDLEP